MKIGKPAIIVIGFCCCLFSFQTRAQSLPDKKANQSPGLFANDNVLEITIRGNVRDLLNDRGEMPQPHPLTLSYASSGNSTVIVSALAKTRGHFRKLKENCLYPPLQIHFIKNDSLEQSVFKDQDKIKLVMPCQGDEYVIREWLVYKLYNLVTPKSFKTRLAKINMLDSNASISFCHLFFFFQ